MNNVQIFIILIIIIKVIIEILIFVLKRAFKEIRVDESMKKTLETILHNLDNCEIVIGNNYAYDFLKNQIIIKKYDILHLDEYYIFVHEYGHYIDILNKTKDFKSFITILKIATFWLIIIICILMFGNFFLSSLHDFFIFSLILETILITIDIFITMKLEISANVVAIKIMQKQIEVKLKLRIFYLLSTISQVIDRFFFLLMVLLIYIVFH